MQGERDLDSERIPRYGWVVLGFFTLNYTLVLIPLLTLGLLLPDIADEFSLSPSQQGWLASSVLFANLIFEVPINWLASRYPVWRVSSVCFVAASLFLLLHGWSATFAVLIIARVGLGMWLLSTEAPRTLVILQWMPRRYIGAANGVTFSALEAMLGVGWVVIPFILGWLDSWRDTLYLWAGVCLFANVLWVVLGRDRITPEYSRRIGSQAETPLSSLFKYKEPWILGIGVVGSVAGRSSFGTFWPTFTQDYYGTSLTMAGLVVGVVAFAGAPAMLGTSIIPYFTRRAPLVLTACGVILSGSFIGTLFTDSMPLLFLSGIGVGVGFAFLPVVMTRLYEQPGIKPREVAVVAALIFTMLWGGSAIGPLVVGLIQEATDNLRLALVITSLAPLALSGAGLAISGRRGGAVEMDTEPSPTTGTRSK